ncbi:hypothetical protein FNZ56_08505 [Pseudoluteimonas lycopersici]|uniref:Uncharacterized protein n=1 Tax=Pseudoluteimonas lycopersici TaxID=1324796 RepID=A0A516V5W3_9GAMM|nr:hypothetical protein [Lysobacter lycopersici]QDQ73913.1 hypothetical protein FNZ56_08505 [Lysobacter lycopersici]
MTDILLRDIDPALIERLNRVAAANGWKPDESLHSVLEHGLHALELAATLRLNDREENALQSAINAMEGVADDPGFALIGRVPAAQGA